MRPQDTIRVIDNYIKNLEAAKKMGVYVGLPKEKVGGKVYNSGMTVIEVGAVHEYGGGNNPQRSFLRTPFTLKQKDMARVISQQFNAVAEKGKDAETALNIIGAKAQEISQGAFTTRGYGTWKQLDPQTIKRKGSSQILIDKGILRSSITWVVR